MPPLQLYAPRGLSRPTIRGERVGRCTLNVIRIALALLYLALLAWKLVPAQTYQTCTVDGNATLRSALSVASTGAPRHISPSQHSMIVTMRSRPRVSTATTMHRDSALARITAVSETPKANTVMRIQRSRAIAIRSSAAAETNRSDAWTVSFLWPLSSNNAPFFESSNWTIFIDDVPDLNATIVSSQYCTVESNAADAVNLAVWVLAFAVGVVGLVALIVVRNAQRTSATVHLATLSAWSLIGSGSPLLFVGVVVGWGAPSDTYQSDVISNLQGLWLFAFLAQYGAEIHGILIRSLTLFVAIALAFPAGSFDDYQTPPALLHFVGGGSTSAARGEIRRRWRGAVLDGVAWTHRAASSTFAHLAVTLSYAVSSLSLLVTRAALGSDERGSFAEAVQPLISGTSVLEIRDDGAEFVGGSALRDTGFVALISLRCVVELLCALAVCLLSARGSRRWFDVNSRACGSVAMLNVHFHRLVACNVVTTVLAPAVAVDAVVSHFLLPLLQPAVYVWRASDGADRVDSVAVIGHGFRTDPAQLLWFAALQAACLYLLTPSRLLPHRDGEGSKSTVPRRFSPLTDIAATSLGDLARRVVPSMLPRPASAVDRRQISQSRVWAAHFEATLVVETLHSLCALMSQWWRIGHVRDADATLDAPQPRVENPLLRGSDTAEAPGDSEDHGICRAPTRIGGNELVSARRVRVDGHIVDVVIYRHVGTAGAKRGTLTPATIGRTSGVVAVLISIAEGTGVRGDEFADCGDVGSVCEGLQDVLLDATERHEGLDVAVLAVQPTLVASPTAPGDALQQRTSNSSADPVATVAGCFCTALSLRAQALTGSQFTPEHPSLDSHAPSGRQSSCVRRITLFHIGELSHSHQTSSAGISRDMVAEETPLAHTLRFGVRNIPVLCYEVCVTLWGPTRRRADTAVRTVLMDEGFLRNESLDDKSAMVSIGVDNVRVAPGPVAAWYLRQIRRVWESPTAIYSGAEVVERLAMAAVAE